MENLQRVKFLSGAEELDRLPHRRAKRESRPSPCVPIHLGEHRTVKVQALVKCPGGVDGILSRHGVDHEEDLVRGDRLLDRLHFLHHLLVDVQPSGGIDDDEVTRILPRVNHSPPRERDSVLPGLLVERNIDLARQCPQLLDGCRPIRVRRDKKRMMAAPLEVQGKFCAEGRLPRSLQTRHKDHGGWSRTKCHRCRGGPEQRDELVMDQLHNELAGCDARENVLPQRLCLDVVDELLRNLVVDVGIQEDPADLTEGLANVGLADLPLPPKPFQRSFKLTA